MTRGEHLRRWSLQQAKMLGYAINENLPFLDAAVSLKPLDAVVNRILCLTAMATAAWGVPSAEVRAWLKREGLLKQLSTTERLFLQGQGDTEMMQLCVEALWALAWAEKAVPTLDFAAECSDELITLVPNVRDGESAEQYRQRWTLRTRDEILQQADLAYCIHWAIQDALLHGISPAGGLHPLRVIQRRHALEWLIQPTSWDEVSMDT